MNGNENVEKGNNILHSAMSIQQLPDHVIAQIKSSTTITSLNGVVCGLVKNSLDANATKINISIDYVRGNCSVEDNGLGISPQEFKSTGGLGKLHYTSRFPPCNHSHGRHGVFLASVASLSLLSITSHHSGYHSHNSVRIHNSEILARHTPSLPEQRLLSFPHGTRTTVRDLFGSMPVRVKQRALDADRGANAKNWERLKHSLVALLLAWPCQVTITIHDSLDQRNFTLRAPDEPLNPQENKHDIPSLVTRVSRIFFQAQLSDDRSRDLWVSLKASTGHISVVGAVSLVPVVSRQMQFISIGVRPISNEHGSNVLYEEINRLFANSSFGVKEESSDLNEDEQKRRAKDRRYKTDGYTNQELRGRKGVDRWPMFYIKINLEEPIYRLSECDVEEILNERHKSLREIVDILTAVIYQFLKAHHFRPKYSKPRQTASSRSLRHQDVRSESSSRSSTPKAGHRTDRTRVSRSRVSSGDLASTRLSFALDTSRSRPESPFNSWTRVKSGQPQYAHPQVKSHLHRETSADLSATQPPIKSPRVESDDPDKEDPLVAPDGTLLRIPFPDIETSTPKFIEEPPRENPSIIEERPELRGGEEVLWSNPATKETLVINARTGVVIQPVKNRDAISEGHDDINGQSSRKRLRVNTRPASRDERSSWLGDLLSSWENPVFPSQEPPIPVVFDEEKALAFTDSSEGHCHGCHSGSLDVLQPSYSVEGRLSKENLRNATVIAQLDCKFILVKVPLSSSPFHTHAENEPGPSLLVIIDQHAADERCWVEALMKDYFVVVENTDTSTEQPQPLVQAQVELLEKPLTFDISAQDSRQLERSVEYFRCWGILFKTSLVAKSKPNSQRRAQLLVFALPPSIAERCRQEPRLLVELLRKEAWKVEEQWPSASQHIRTETDQDGGGNSTELHWLSRFHGCPGGILEMINSRACRSSIMFNDHLSHEECADLVRRLTDCALPFQCAHGRPSMVPLVDLGNSPLKEVDIGRYTGNFGKEFRRWKQRFDSSKAS
ncbi:uncharacterized protein GGS25DRAFT_483464 [Hypoxylon fragiforme]|uniref:uncharacterized protein n=1 Tax=Hypoxylon fragiforme TaxID=63214 RepID=UPI0020C608CC|nr:uncharacterized protein GGS25DRAFT_483464 [Hypoxylon fragiforme]KAI2611628.1 hypothetical protein GGS25DRAFT_483464 [Hypoxylon fragiforme]